jgi:DNA-damage-inducible protein D
MGPEELAGNLFRVIQTSSRVKSQGVHGLEALKFTANKVGKEVRQILTKNGGTPPESLPISEDIAKVQRRLMSANEAMTKLDGQRKSKNPALSLPL